ncbi:MAG: hypothetical protein ACT4PV_06685 [Planctomycetaceae bacterium]
MMPRARLLLLVLLAWGGPLPAREQVEEILLDVERILRDDSGTESVGQRYDRAIERAYDAARLDPNCADAFFKAAVIRIQYVIEAPEQTQEVLGRLRAQGAPVEEIERIRAEAAGHLQELLEFAYRDFSLMEQALARKGRSEPDLILLASALIKFAGREFEKTKHGDPGAIADLKALVQRKYRVEMCAEFLARSYLQLGSDQYVAEEYDKAQELWKEALRWAPTPALRRLIRNNQAGAFQADNAFDNAEAVLRQLVKDEPDRPEHWKNMGLLLGFRARLKEALFAYGKAREACARRAGSEFLAVLHGNAWLRAALIHANLLPEEGDMLEAWRLLLEYRAIFGDDYAFSLAFAEVAFEHGEYAWAARYYEHARSLLPHCPQAYQRLVELAPRLPGTSEERQARIERARAEYESNKARFSAREEEVNLVRLCSGTRDIGDGRLYQGRLPPADPDLLAGLGPDKPPDWLVAAASTRKAFVPVTGLTESGEAGAPAPRGGSEGEGVGGGGGIPWLPVGGGAGTLALLVLAGWFLRRRRDKRAA